MDDSSGSQRDHGRCRLSVLEPIPHSRPGLEVLRVVPPDHRGGWRRAGQAARTELGFELVRGALGRLRGNRQHLIAEAPMVRLPDSWPVGVDTVALE